MIRSTSNVNVNLINIIFLQPTRFLTYSTRCLFFFFSNIIKIDRKKCYPFYVTLLFAFVCDCVCRFIWVTRRAIFFRIHVHILNCNTHYVCRTFHSYRLMDYELQLLNHIYAHRHTHIHHMYRITYHSWLSSHIKTMLFVTFFRSAYYI